MIYNDPHDSMLDKTSAGESRPDGLPTALVVAIAEALVPSALQSAHIVASERVQQRLRERIRAEAPSAAAEPSLAMTDVPPPPPPATAPRAGRFITLANSLGKSAEGGSSGEGWIEMLPKAHAKLLYTDGEAESYMIRLEPGAWAPAHDHPADEECLVLEGTLWQGDVFLKAGDFHVARPGDRHGDLRTDTGALVFIRYGKPLAQYLRM